MIPWSRAGRNFARALLRFPGFTNTAQGGRAIYPKLHSQSVVSGASKLGYGLLRPVLTFLKEPVMFGGKIIT